MRVSKAWLFFFVVNLVLAVLASQRVKSWPVPYAWEVGIGVTEWGAWVVLASAILLAIGLRRRHWAGSALALLTLGLSLQPPVEAAQMDSEFSLARLFMPQPHPAVSRTVRYSGDESMDIYLPRDQTHPAGAVLVVHGGSWTRGTRQEFSALNQPLLDHGYLVASMDYRLAPAHPYPAAVKDLDAAWDYLLAHADELKLDRKRMFWLGRSAGAHLALLEAYGRRPSRAVVAFYPPTDMVWSYEHPSNPIVLDSKASIRDFLGGTPEEKPSAYLEASPLQQVGPHTPPTLLLHGGHDDLVYVEQSYRLQKRLQDAHVPNQLVEIPWANHGFDVNLNGPSGQLSTLAVLRFLEAQR